MELTEEIKREMFWWMLVARRLDERAWILHHQGRIAFHISGIGHEATQVGAGFAIRRGYDWVVPYYRDLAFSLLLGYTPRQFVLSLMGKREEPNSGGRQMPNHWSLRSANIVSHSAPVATQTVHAAGIGLAIKLKKEDKVVLTSLGEGSTSQGEWYEAINWAVIHKLPVIFIVQNNKYPISEGLEKQNAIKSVADKACGLGLPGISVDGTDVFAVYEVVAKAVANARAGNGATLIETVAYRMTPHLSVDDDRSYRPRQEGEEHKKTDPLILAKINLQNEKILDLDAIEEMEEQAKGIIDAAIDYAENAPYPAGEEASYPVYVEEIRHD
jgi:2-oxoisovalerate dehydrogenase E1 component alpha subunit